MTTSVNQNVPENKPAGAVGGQDSHSMFKLSIAPAGLAAPIIYDIMRLEGDILKYAQDQRASMVKAQGLEAQGQAKATQDAGQAQFAMFIEMGVFAAAGAIIGYGLTFAGGNDVDDKEYTDAQSKVTSVKIVDDTVTNPPTGNAAGGQNGIGNLGGQREIDAETLSQQFEARNYSGAKENDVVTQRAVEKLQTRKSPAELATWKEGLAEDYKNSSQNYNSAVSKQTTLNSRRDTWKGLANTGGSTAGNTFQGIGQNKKAVNDADAALLGSATQQAGSASSDSGQAASKAFDTQNAEIQVLMNIVRAGSVNGG